MSSRPGLPPSLPPDPPASSFETKLRAFQKTAVSFLLHPSEVPRRPGLPPSEPQHWLDRYRPQHRRLTRTGRMLVISPVIVLALLALLATCNTQFGVPGW